MCDVNPIFHKARPVPFAIRPAVTEALDKMVAKGYLCEVASSKWATPVVVVPKKNKEIRICCDFKVTLNKYLDTAAYPLPTQQDLFSTLAKGKYFSKLDLRNAYLQLEVDPGTRPLLTINTHKGLFRFKRMPFGLANAPSYFQSVMDRVLSGIGGVICYIDDVLIATASIEEHLALLKTIFARLAKYNIKLKKEKCLFLQKEIEYLGHLVTGEGIRPLDHKVQAIQKAKTPTNISELRSFLGLVNFYGKFIPNLPELLKPLHELLHKKRPWVWTKECGEAIDKCKNSITSERVLVPYDTTLPLCLATDASQIGVGAVLSHIIEGQERPIMFASRTLSGAEQNYSQIEKEALAIIYGVTKFHQFIYGRKFILITDHKPLVTILGPKSGIPTLSTSRLQRWALILSAYTYDIKFRRTQDHGNADLLSRFPVGCEEIPRLNNVYALSFVEELPITAEEIATETEKDEVLSLAKFYTQQGWPEKVADHLRPYFQRKLELTVDGECLVWGMRVVIPPSLRIKMLNCLHETHSGMNRMKAVARSHFWWPNLDTQIEFLVNKCRSCQQSQDGPNKGKWQPWRCTPHVTTGKTPSELFIGRALRTRVSLIHPSLASRVRDQQARQMKYDRRTHLEEFQIDDLVWCKNFRGGDKWIPGKIVGKKGTRVYTILIHGQVKAYHRDQIRKRWRNGEEDESGDGERQPEHSRGAGPSAIISEVVRDRGYMESLSPGLTSQRSDQDSEVQSDTDDGKSLEPLRSLDPEALKEEGPVLRRNPPRARRPPVKLEKYISPEEHERIERLRREAAQKTVDKVSMQCTGHSAGVVMLVIDPSDEGKGSHEDDGRFTRAPEPFNFSNPGDWPKWIRRFERFRQASGLINNPENEQVNMLVFCMGDNADDILLSCKIASDQLENYDKVIECFESHFIPRCNIIYERARFNQRCQQEGEKVNEFITALHSLAEHCNFGMLHDELIRDRIVVGVRDRALSERMQLDTDLTLVKATLMAKQLESVKEQQSSLYQQDSIDQIKKMPNHIKETKRHEPKIRQFKSNQLGGSSHGFTRCGNSNNHDWKNCPAMNSYCSKCKKKGHYAKVCRSEAINEIKSEIAFLGSVEDNSKKWIVPIKVNNRQINFKIDTGADVNVLPLQNYHQSYQRIKLEKSDKISQGPNGIPLETVGMIHVKLQNKGQHLNSKIYIVNKLKQPLLSGETSEKLNIVRMIQQLSSGGRGGQRGRLGSGDNRGCYNCREEGHRKFECTKPARGGGRGRGQSRDGGSNNTCYNCGEVGHRKYECNNNTAEDGGQEENQRKSKKACYTCGEFGHKKDDCPKSGTQESGDEEESSDNEEEETPQKRKQAEDSEEEEVEAEEPPKKKSKKPKKKEEDCYLTLQAYRTMPLESARSREMRRPPLRHQPGSQGDARMTRSKTPRRIALHQRPHLQEMEGCRGTTKTRIQRRASLQCQPCIQDMEGQSRYLE
ncbi:K02A2.6-like, partial [Cordylochernes scorpioides]